MAEYLAGRDDAVLATNASGLRKEAAGAADPTAAAQRVSRNITPTARSRSGRAGRVEGHGVRGRGGKVAMTRRKRRMKSAALATCLLPSFSDLQLAASSMHQATSQQAQAKCARQADTTTAATPNLSIVDVSATDATPHTNRE